jgi:hypothetical protein
LIYSLITKLLLYFSCCFRCLNQPENRLSSAPFSGFQEVKALKTAKTHSKPSANVHLFFGGQVVKTCSLWNSYNNSNVFLKTSLIMSKKNQHVVPTGNKWAVRGAGNTRLTKKFDTQYEAINHARGIAKKNEAEVVIYRKNGQIRDKDSYGNDPSKYKDRKY